MPHNVFRSRVPRLGNATGVNRLALQMLPQLLSYSLKKTGEEKTACILVATSGDTGKAAMEGFPGWETPRA